MIEFFNTLTKQNPFLASMFGLFGAGILTYMLKDIPIKILNFLEKRLTTTLSVTNMNTSYYTLMDILNSDNLVNTLRSIRFYNGKWGASSKVTKGIGTGSHFVKYRNTYLVMTVIAEKTQNQDDKLELKITKLGRSHKIFDDLKKDIETYDKRSNGTVSIYKYTKDWTYMNEAKLRNFDTIIMDLNNENKLIDGIDKFLKDEEWYMSHGIPYQLGIFLQGESGTGKSSIIKAIASKYNLNICILSSNKLYMIGAAVSQLPKDSLLVVEDVDSNPAVFKRSGVEDVNKTGLNKYKRYKDEDNDGDEEAQPTTDDAQDENVTATVEEGRLINIKENSALEMERIYDLAEILNGIDGILSAYKRILVMTSNRSTVLDPALKRPGRIDIELYISYATQDMFTEFLYKFFTDRTEYIDTIKDKIILNVHNITVSKLQNDYRMGKTIESFISDYCVLKE